MEYMAFGTAKLVIKSHECWKLHHFGIPVEDIAKEEHISVEEVRKRIRRTEYYIRNHMLEYQLKEAKRRIVAGSFAKITKDDELPVRCASGCRFSPLH